VLVHALGKKAYDNTYEIDHAIETNLKDIGLFTKRCYITL